MTVPSVTLSTEEATISEEDRFYASLSEDDATLASRVAHEVRAKSEDIIYNKIWIGQELLKVKHRLDHGDFEKWFRLAFEWNIRTAQRYMMVAKVLGDKYDTLSYLPFTTLGALARATTEVRDQIVDEIGAGKRLSPLQIGQLLDKQKTSRTNAVEHSRLAALNAAAHLQECLSDSDFDALSRLIKNANLTQFKAALCKLHEARGSSETQCLGDATND